MDWLTSQCAGWQGWPRLLRSKSLFVLSLISAALVGPFLLPEQPRSPALLGPHEHWIRALAFSPDGRLLAAAGGLVDRSSELIVWDVAGGGKRTLLRGKDACIEALAFSPDGRWLGVVDREQTARLLEAGSGREQARFGCGPAWQQFVAFSADSRRLIVPHFDGSFSSWDILGHRLDRLPPPSPPQSAAYAGATQTFLATDSTRESFNVWSGAAGKVRLQVDVPTPIWSGALSPDEKILALAAQDGRLYFCDPTAGRTWRTEEKLDDRVNCLAFSPDGRRLVSGGQDHAVRLWDVSTGRALATLGTHDAAVFAVAFAPEGRQVASAGFDKCVRLWPTPDGLAQNGQGNSAAGCRSGEASTRCENG
jgi:dipeptidyl aminopeptidase/acylaminoacyl peptidase